MDLVMAYFYPDLSLCESSFIETAQELEDWIRDKHAALFYWMRPLKYLVELEIIDFIRQSRWNIKVMHWKLCNKSNLYDQIFSLPAVYKCKCYTQTESWNANCKFVRSQSQPEHLKASTIEKEIAEIDLHDQLYVIIDQFGSIG